MSRPVGLFHIMLTMDIIIRDIKQTLFKSLLTCKYMQLTAVKLIHECRQLVAIGLFSGVTLYQGAPGSKFSKAPPPLSSSAKGTS